MKNKLSMMLIAVLLFATVLAAFFHLSDRTDTLPGEILIRMDGREQSVCVDQMAVQNVEGEIVNGKGDTLRICESGIAVSDVLESAGVNLREMTSLTVVASDEYRAELTGSEIRQADRVWLIVQKDGQPRLIVFGDPDSRRNVSNIVRMEVK